jgi:acyl dehydratase
VKRPNHPSKLKDILQTLRATAVRVEYWLAPDQARAATEEPHRMKRIALSDLPEQVGLDLGTSPWLEIDQARINAFAEVTGDPQWIHVDPARASQGPFGSTVAHGFLTLSLLPWFLEHSFAVEGSRMGVNYGLNRVRFPSPVPVGSRLRAHSRLLSCEAVEGGFQLVIEATIEREGAAKPVCVAELVARRYA